MVKCHACNLKHHSNPHKQETTYKPDFFVKGTSTTCMRSVCQNTTIKFVTSKYVNAISILEI